MSYYLWGPPFSLELWRVCETGVKRVHDWWANPWGQPRFLAAVTWLYMVWAIVPV